MPGPENHASVQVLTRQAPLTGHCIRAPQELAPPAANLGHEAGRKAKVSGPGLAWAPGTPD